MQTHDDLFAAIPGPAAPAPSRLEAAPAVARSASHAPDAGPATTPEAILQLQRLAGNASVGAMVAREAAAQGDEDGLSGRSPVLDVVGNGGGRPLDPGLRGEMEGRLGADFGDVRVHTDSPASQSAEAVSAHAYTVGSDVVFRSDRWNPDSSTGKETLAHELTHVIQQRSGPVDGTSTGNGIRLSDPGDPYEQAASANASAAMSATPVAPAAPAAQGDFVQRATPEEEEELQGDFVQRATPEEEEELQGDFVQRATPEEEEELQGDFVQRATPEEEEELQGDFVQRATPEEEEELQGDFVQRATPEEEEEPAAVE